MARPPVVPLPESVFLIDRNSPTPIYHELAARIEAAIIEGEIPPGARLEEEISLSLQLGVSRPTVRRAIQELVDKGLVVRRRGIGTQVVPPSAVSRKLELTSLWEDLSRIGKVPTTRVVVCETIPATPDVATDLGISEGDRVLHIERVRFADEIPLALLENFLPERYADLTAEELSTRGLYDALSRRGVTVRVAHQSISARAADRHNGPLLTVRVGSPLLTMHRTAYDAAGSAVETGTHLYRPDMYAFETTLVRS